MTASDTVTRSRFGIEITLADSVVSRTDGRATATKYPKSEEFPGGWLVVWSDGTQEGPFAKRPEAVLTMTRDGKAAQEAAKAEKVAAKAERVKARAEAAKEREKAKVAKAKEREAAKKEREKAKAQRAKEREAAKKEKAKAAAVAKKAAAAAKKAAAKS